MRTIEWIAGVLITLPLAASELTPPPGANSCRHTLTVLIGNYAHVSNEMLAGAQLEAERILSEASLGIQWVDIPTSFTEELHGQAGAVFRPEPVFTIQLLSGAMRARLRRPATEFGFAIGSTGYVFYDRIEQIRRTALYNRRALLGHVLAHEIIHLLLGPGAHTPVGLMQPHWNPSELVQIQQGVFRLKPGQMDRLRNRAAKAGCRQ